jgi:ubiquinone/menaquinone biosynthesis C-methylase UbiE
MANLEQTRQAWEACAEAYDRALTATDMRAAEEALRMANVGPGMRLLDIAAGPGAVSIPAARLGADVLAIDYSHAMVDLLARKATALHLSNLQTRLMDGTALELDDDSFDVACSELGIMLFPDRARGLREMARVVKRGGAGVLVVLGAPQRVQPIALFFDAMEEALPGYSRPAHSPLFCLENLEVLRGEMEDAGFRDVQVRPFESRLDVQSGAHLWDTLMAGAPAIAGLMKSVPEGRRRAVRSSLVEIVRTRFGDLTPVSLPMAFNIGLGVKPSARPASARVAGATLDQDVGH